jgi:hypothetical protein
MVEVGTVNVREQNGIMVQEAESAKEKALKPAQVFASALAAVTAAFLGSTLGVAGTIAGAGIASLVTTIGSEVYLRSLRKTREAARRTKRILAAPPDTRLRQETRALEPPPPPPNPLIRPETVRPGEQTVHLPVPGRDEPSTGEPTVFRSPSTDTPTVLRSPHGNPRSEKTWWKSRWALAAGGSVVAFVVGMLAVTGFESLTGHALSGGTGTTVGRIVQGPPPPAPTTTQQPPVTVTREPASTPASTGAPTGTSAPATSTPVPSSPASPTSSPPPSSPVSSTPITPSSSG